MNTNFDIEQFLSLEGYATEVRKSRRKNNKDGVSTQEFFTPYSVVNRMCDKIPESDWADPSKTFLEPCFGNGQFLVMIIYRRLLSGVDWKTTLENLYGLELMQDNVDETKQKVLTLLDNLEIDYDRAEALKIMDKNLVCHDFFNWNFEQWREMTEEEVKKSKKK